MRLNLLEPHLSLVSFAGPPQQLVMLIARILSRRPANRMHLVLHVLALAMVVLKVSALCFLNSCLVVLYHTCYTSVPDWGPYCQVPRTTHNTLPHLPIRSAQGIDNYSRAHAVQLGNQQNNTIRK